MLLSHTLKRTPATLVMNNTATMNLIARVRVLEDFCKIDHEDDPEQDTEISDERLALIEKIILEKSSLDSKEAMSDLYTSEVLRQQFSIHKQYVESRIATSKALNIRIRFPGIPEDISENMIKMLIKRIRGDETCTWNCDGDLYSQIEKKQECKCFTSSGPISFTPSSGWNVIYFLDATKWLNDKFTLYRLPLKYTSDEWQNIKMNKTETFRQQADAGRRPRIGWSALYPQISQYAEELWTGGFEDIVS